MFNRLLIWWDNLMYRMSYRSVQRICERDPGVAYLFELWVRKWRKEHPISPSSKSAVEWFFETQTGDKID